MASVTLICWSFCLFVSLHCGRCVILLGDTRHLRRWIKVTTSTDYNGTKTATILVLIIKEIFVSVGNQNLPDGISFILTKPNFQLINKINKDAPVFVCLMSLLREQFRKKCSYACLFKGGCMNRERHQWQPLEIASIIIIIICRERCFCPGLGSAWNVRYIQWFQFASIDVFAWIGRYPECGLIFRCQNYFRTHIFWWYFPFYCKQPLGIFNIWPKYDY